MPVESVVAEVPSAPERASLAVATKDVEENAWHSICGALKISGLASQLASHCVLDSFENNQMVLTLEEAGAELLTDATRASLLDALNAWADTSIQLTINVRAVTVETPSVRYHRLQEETQQRLEQMMYQDPFVQQLQSQLGGEIVPGSIKPKKERKES